MKKLLVIATALLTFSNAHAGQEKPSFWDSPGGDAVEGSALIAGGTYAWVTASMGTIAGGAAATTGVLIGASGAVGYGTGKVIRSIDAKTGNYINKLVYYVGDKTYIFEGIRIIEVGVKDTLENFKKD